jgi:NAD+ synthase (glutamine-hydrolysing)
MKIGIAQIDTRAGDFQATSNRIAAYSEQAARQGVELLVFPSATLTGPLPVPYVEQEGQLADLVDVFADLAARVACPCLVPAMLMAEDDPFPEVVLISRDNILPLRFAGLARAQSVDKDESDADDEGDWSATRFSFGGLSFGAAFDYDSLEDLSTSSHHVDAIVYFPSYSYAIDDPSSALGASLSEGRFIEDAKDAHAWIIASGPLGCYDTKVYSGASFILAPSGELIAAAPAFEEGLISSDISQSSNLVDGPLEPAVYDRPLFCWETLSLGVRDFVQKLGYSDVALVLDGTLASMACVALASDALGPTHVHTLVATPCIGDIIGDDRHIAEVHEDLSEESSVHWAHLLTAAARASLCHQFAENLHVNIHERSESLGSLTHAAFEASRTSEDRLAVVERDVAFAQIELSELVRNTGALLVSSRDKTWLALEAREQSSFAAGLMPLGDLYRSDVIEMMRRRNTVSPIFPILDVDLCDIPEVEGGDAGYVESGGEALLRRVDKLLSMHIEWEHPVNDLVSETVDEDFVNRILARLDECAMARVATGVILEASSRTLAMAHRPFGYGWRDHLRPAAQNVDDSLEQTIREIANAVQGSDAAEDDAVGDLGDILGYLRDFPLDMGHDGRRSSFRGFMGGSQGFISPSSLDGSPFSEN